MLSSPLLFGETAQSLAFSPSFCPSQFFQRGGGLVWSIRPFTVRSSLECCLWRFPVFASNNGPRAPRRVALGGYYNNGHGHGHRACTVQELYLALDWGVDILTPALATGSLGAGLPACCIGHCSTGSFAASKRAKKKSRSKPHDREHLTSYKTSLVDLIRSIIAWSGTALGQLTAPTFTSRAKFLSRIMCRVGSLFRRLRSPSSASPSGPFICLTFTDLQTTSKRPSNFHRRHFLGPLPPLLPQEMDGLHIG